MHVIGNDAYRQASDTPGGWRNCNLRTQFGRVLKRAGLKPWPRLFHGQRASRETELSKEFSIHVVTTWLGNIHRLAMKHYLTTTEDDLSRAVGRLVEEAVQNQTHETDVWGEIRSGSACRSESQNVVRNEISPCDTRAYAKHREVLPRPAKTISGEDRTGTPLENTGNSRFFDQGAANSGAVPDAMALAADLARIVAAWPMLPAAIRRAILTLVECDG